MIVQISAITLSDASGFWTIRKKLGPNIARTTTVWIEFSVQPVFTMISQIALILSKTEASRTCGNQASGEILLLKFFYHIQMLSKSPTKTPSLKYESLDRRLVFELSLFLLSDQILLRQSLVLKTKCCGWGRTQLQCVTLLVTLSQTGVTLCLERMPQSFTARHLLLRVPA